MQAAKIYVASSWRNPDQPAVVDALRAAGHEVYDFRNPRDGDHGFSWAQIDIRWQSWTPAQFRFALEHPIAKRGFKQDADAMLWADTCVLVMPCGRSAHTELGWFCGAGKRTVILLDDGEPELMYRFVDHLCVDIGEVLDVLSKPDAAGRGTSPTLRSARKAMDIANRHRSKA